MFRFLKTVDWRDVGARAFKTFVQTAISYAITALTGVNFSKQLGKTFWVGFALSAGAAGLSVAWNSIIIPAIDAERAESGMDDYMSKQAIEKAKVSSNAQPTKDDSNG